jgi:energy-converting hydrogenase Eha subunit B
MVGQIHNFLKIFDKLRGFIENPVVREAANIAPKIKTTGTVAYDLFNYGNQLDNPNASNKR